MSRRQLPRAAATILDAATFLPGEIAVDLTNDEIRYAGDGGEVGGIALARKDGANVSVTATGSLTARTLAARFAASRDVRDFGAVWDGSSHPLSGYYSTLAAAQAVYPHATALTNEIDWAAAQAAVNALAVTGGDVITPNGVGLFDQTLVLGDGTSTSKSTRVGIRLRSIAGVSGSADLSEYTTPGEGCRIKWVGADSTSAIMLDVRGPIHSIRVEGIVFDCAGLAGIGIKIRNLFNSHFENVRVTEWTTIAWDFQSYDATLPSGVTVHSVMNIFMNCGCFTPWDSGAFATAASALRMYGGPVNNAGMSRNTFIGGDWHYGGAANTYGLALYYADNNLFQGMLFTAVGGGTSGNSIRLIKNETGDNQGLFPLENTFIQCPGIDGIGVYDDSGNSISSDEIGANLFLGHSTSDGAPVPTHNKITALLHTGEITNLIVRDDRFILKDNSDGTKKAQFQLSGLTTATTRTKTLQDVSGTIYESGGTDVAVADGGTGASTDRGATQNLKTWYVIGASAVAVPLTGTTSETVLATIAIPAGAIGPNGQIRIMTLWSMTNNANNKTMSVRLGGIGGTAHQAAVIASQAHQQNNCRIANRNSASSQVSQSATGFGWNANTASPVTGAINTANAQDLVITGTLASSGDTLTLESYIVELFYQA